MFTGIIEALGVVRETFTHGAKKSFWVESSLSPESKPDQSINHNGVCLTVEEVKGNTHKVTAIKETLAKTHINTWENGDLVNLERSLPVSGRLDGHLVQGHVDTTARCLKSKQKKGSWDFEFEFSKKFAELVIEKGSIAINGISLTVFDVRKKSFRVAVIPYTFEHTNIKHLSKGGIVNIEFDMIGKYIQRYQSLL